MFVLTTHTHIVVLDNLPDDIEVTTDEGEPTASVSWTPPLVIPSYTLTVDYNPGHNFPIGTTVVTYTAINDLADVVTYSFTVSVIG